MSTKIELSESLQKTIALEQRALADGGTLVNRNSTVNSIPYTLLKQNPSLVIGADAFKESVLYGIIPNNSTGDFSYTQNTANGTIINQNGDIETVPANTPRITWINGVPEILVEETRTNLVTYSDDFTQADWQKSSLGTGFDPVVTPNAAPSIIDGQNADLINFDRGAGNTSGDLSTLRIDIPHISGNDYTGSMWIKAGTPSDIGKEIGMRPFGSSISVFTLTAEWQKVEATLNATVNNNIMDIVSRGTRTADNQVSLLLAGVQNEKASNALSLIPTNGAIATRNDDILNKTGISSLIGQTEGAIFMDCELSNLIQSNIGWIFDVFENAVTDRISVYQNAGSSSITVLMEENDTIVSINSISITNNRLKIFVVYTPTSFKVFINGNQVVNDVVTFGGYTNCNEVIIGSRGGGTLGNEGVYIDSFQLFKTPVSDQVAINSTTL